MLLRRGTTGSTAQQSLQDTLLNQTQSSFLSPLCHVTLDSLHGKFLHSSLCFQVTRDRLSPADAVRDPAAADQSEELHRGRHTHHL